MKIELKKMKLKYFLILVFVLVYSSNLNAQNNLNRITGLSSTSASVAYSLRQLSTSYTGPLVRIKVGTVFYDVYPDASTYNFSLSSKISASISTYNAAVSAASTNALSTIITAGTTNATVAIWYDQSGYAVNVLNASALANIITSGTINTMNGQPTINFTSSNSYLSSTATVNYSSQTLATLNAAVQDVASTDYISGIISTGNNGGWGLCYDPTTTIKGYWIDASGSNGASSKENTKNAKIVTGLVGKTTNSYIYINSVLKDNRTAQSIANGSADNIYVGVRGNASNRKFIGNISEVFMFPKTLSAAEQTALETSQAIFLTPSVTITSSASGAVCAGTNVTFSANISGFTNPSYQWYANETEISGARSSTYSSTNLTNGVQVYVKVTEGIVDGAIVTNGLRFNLDAGNSASYPGTGTTWTDLSGNGNHGTLVNGATYSSDNGGSILFNGTNSNINLNKNATAIGIYDNSYTADAWVYPTDLSNDRGMFGDEVAAVRQGLHLTFRGSTIHQGHYSSDANIGSVSTNSWYHIVFTFDKATGATRMYKNGVDQGNSGTIQSYIGTSSIHLGQAYGNTGFFQGKGAVYKMYNRVLSSAEVTTNYNALRNRFGLTGVGSTVVNSNSITTTVNARPATPVITITGDGCINKTSLTTTSGSTSYAWYKDDVIISGITTNTLIPNASGAYHVIVSNGTCSNTSSSTTIYTCAKTADGKMLPITSSTTMVRVSGEINNKFGVDERGLMLTKPYANIPTGTNPVTTGLILYLDATRSASYAGTGSTWADISGQIPAGSATLVGSPVFGSGSTENGSGSFTFGSNINASTTKTNTIDNEITYIAWVNPSQSFDGGVIVRRTSQYSGATSLYLANSNLSYDWDNANWSWRSNLMVPNNQWSMIVISVNAGSVTAYLCNATGINSVSSGRGHSSLTSRGATNFHIGYDTYNYPSRAFKGKMGTAMVYSVALSSTDITAIFNAQKASFGL